MKPADGIRRLFPAMGDGLFSTYLAAGQKDLIDQPMKKLSGSSDRDSSLRYCANFFLYRR